LKNYKPFSITFHMTTPICLGHPYIHLDGLLAHLILREQTGLDYYVLPSKQPLTRQDFYKMNRLPQKLMPLGKLGPVYRASVSQFTPNPLHTTHTLYTATFYKRFHEPLAADQNFKHKTIDTGRGRFRGWMLRLPYFSAETVTFYAYGDLQETLRLLSYAAGLGKKIAAGFGAFKSVSVQELEEDRSIVWKGHAMRPIPLAMCREATEKMLLAFKPPYWNKTNVRPCAAPGSKVILKPGWEQILREQQN